MSDKINHEIKEKLYFYNRNVGDTLYSGYRFPRYLSPYFKEKDRDLRVLDIGCGLGKMLKSLKDNGFNNLYGIDINDESIYACNKNNLNAEKIEDIRDYAKQSKVKFDRVIMSHVLEHINKEYIIDTLIHIKKYLLNEGGFFFLIVPNAQSSTGTYWRYEDFTHTILFTSGSCLYVLKAAGFTNITFIDPDGTGFMSPIKKIVIKPLIAYHKLKEKIWHKILQTSYHKPSPIIYTFDLKVLAT